MGLSDCCISVYDSSGEPTGCPVSSRAVFTEPSVTECETGGATSEDELRKKASRESGLMDIFESWFLSHIYQFPSSYAFIL